jgi:DNA-binding MarR family transcriptional regulator
MKQRAGDASRSSLRAQLERMGMKRWDDDTEPRTGDRARWGGLDIRQMRILRVLGNPARFGPTTREVIEALGLEASLSVNASVSRSLARLEARQLVEAEPGPATDGRRKRWVLSAAGRTLLARMG